MKRRAWLIVGQPAALAMLAAALLLAGCGNAKAPADPFVGTWRQLDYQTSWSPPLVIAKVGGDAYGAALVFTSGSDQPLPARMTLARKGNELTGGLKITNAKALTVKIDYLSATGRITFSSGKLGGGMSEPVEMTKVSDSTAIPTPSP